MGKNPPPTELIREPRGFANSLDGYRQRSDYELADSVAVYFSRMCLNGYGSKST